MRPEEAKWVGAQLVRLSESEISPLLELGSSDLDYRTQKQPIIESEIFAPLRRRGVRVVHSDIKAAEGVDIVGDIYDLDVRVRLKNVGARCLLCGNILLHVKDPASFARACDEILAPGGWMIVSTPQSYPYTLDPTDFGFRPTPEKLLALFPGYKVIEAVTISCGTYLDELRRLPRPLTDLMKRIAKIVLFKGGLEATRSRAHRLLWLVRSYKVSAIFVQKKEE